MKKHAEFWSELQQKTSKFLMALHKYVEMSTATQIIEDDFIKHILKTAPLLSDKGQYTYEENVAYETDILPSLIMKKYRKVYKQKSYFLEYQFKKGVLSVVPKDRGVDYVIPINQSILSAINYKIDQTFQVTTLPVRTYKGKKREIQALEYRHYKRLYYTTLFLWTVNVPQLQEIFKEKEQPKLLIEQSNEHETINRMVHQAYQSIAKNYIYTPYHSYVKTEKGIKHFIMENEKMMYALKIYTKELEQLVYIFSTYHTELLHQATQEIAKRARQHAKRLSS